MKLIKDISYSDNAECKLDIYLPEQNKFSVFVYFHGGGLEKGDKTEADVLAKYLVERNICVVSADYRLYPKAKFPHYIEDAAACVAWVFSHIGDYGDCDKIYIGGSSAGAYLSMMLCFDGKYLDRYGIDPLNIAGYIHNAGQPTSHFNILKEYGLDQRRVIIDETAPLYYIGQEDKYSNMVFIVAENDMESRYEQTMLVKSTLKHFGHKADIEILPGQHCGYVAELNNEGKSVFGEIIERYIAKW